ncbi:MAG: hypothetical protein AABZ08_12345 [Planctomycetota bacterium]
MSGSTIDLKTLSALLPKRLDLLAPVGKLLELPSTGGAYLLCDAEDRPILLAAAEDVRHAVCRRLGSPTDEKTRRANLSEIAARVYWRPTFSRFETAWAHWKAARVIHRGAYRKQLMFGPCWFVRVRLEDAAPRFQSMKEYRDDGATYMGPFPARAAADEWVHILEDAFDLCRYHEVLSQAPHGQACSYFDMGRCPAPCNGTISMEAYRRSMREALSLSVGDRQAGFEALNSRMREASGRQAYERAAGIKQSMELAERYLSKPEHTHLTDIGRVGWFVVQRASSPRKAVRDQLIHACVVTRSTSRWSAPMSIGALETGVADWLATSRACVESDTPDASQWSETVWLIAKHLFEGERAPGLFYRLDSIPESTQLVANILHRFSRAGGDTAPSGPTA